MSKNEFVKIVIVGHVDHGKSTLIGRLFFDTGSLPAEKYEKIKALSGKQGRVVEFAYVMDALQEEQEQNITIDTAHSYFHTDRRNYVIIDAPGHKEFLKNMITGAASADAAILLVDAAEGVREQTRRHAYVLSLLGVRQVIVFVNKLDLVDYRRQRFEEVRQEIESFLSDVGLQAKVVIPGAAREGANIAKRSSRIGWYDGPVLIDALDNLSAGAALDDLPLRFAVQDVYKVGNDRFYAGRVESGVVRIGQKVLIQPGAHRSSIRKLQSGTEAIETARAGDSVGIALDGEFFIERGAVFSAADRPIHLVEEFEASVFWLGAQPLQAGRSYQLKIATSTVKASVAGITERVDSSTLAVIEKNAARLERPETASVCFRSTPFAADLFIENPNLGRFVIVDNDVVAGGGIVRSIRAAEPAEIKGEISVDRRLQNSNGNTLDLTGVEGSLALSFSDEIVKRARRKEFVIKVSHFYQVRQLLDWAGQLLLGFAYSREKQSYRVTLFSADMSAEAAEEYVWKP